VLGGMMQLDEMQLKQFAQHQQPDKVLAKCNKFKELFKTFDWTTK
jgi:hypothetical protein